jgi:hypothetical protein|tara:strand:+ start:330 stop:587 length:258 start_codon:yes stop_codon:yes gene_type:complete
MDGYISDSGLGGLWPLLVERVFANMKKWYQSKTIWFNVLTFVVSSLTALVNGDWIQENPETAAIVSGVIALINIVLRKITEKGIG